VNTGKITVANTAGFPGPGTVHVIGDVVGYFDANNTGSQLVPMTPSRIADTRSGNPVNGPVTPAQPTITINPAGAPGLPSVGSYHGLVVNLTATAPTAGGWLTAYPSNATLPSASNLNFGAGQTVPNLVVVGVGPDGKFKVTDTSALAGGPQVQVIADIVGYYT
jgi:hypothetical protein